MTRRRFLGALSAAGAVGAAGAMGLNRARAQIPPDALADGHRFLIVIGGGGGASIIDGPLAIPASTSANADAINTFPDQVVQRIEGSPFSAVDMRREELGQIPVGFTANQSRFVRAHHNDMMVSTWTRTSVNHAIGQRRAVTGNEAWLGRTLQECVAWQYGADLPLPNVHLSTGSGYTDRGTDRSLPGYCYGEVVADPLLWPLALDSAKGLRGAPSSDLLHKARALRDGTLDPASRFAKVFGESPRLQHWQAIRGEQRNRIEALGLIDKLLFIPESPQLPLSQYGLTASPDVARLRAVFPNYDRDPLESQAALAFLLLKNRVSCTVTLAPPGSVVLLGEGRDALADDTLTNPPLAFDFSHQGHRSTQSLMWHRMYVIMDGLIRLLSEVEYGNGQSMWDRTMIYLASDFGREKKRPPGADEWGTSHDLNNGVLVVSPMVNGNRVLGGVDANTGLTYGFNPQTGEPEPGRNMAEAEIFAGLLQAMRVDTSGSGLPEVPAMRRG